MPMARGLASCTSFCFVLDLEECEEGTSCCEQDCTNYPGGYECYCRAGYRLNADGCGCDGTSQPVYCWSTIKEERGDISVTGNVL